MDARLHPKFKMLFALRQEPTTAKLVPALWSESDFDRSKWKNGQTYILRFAEPIEASQNLNAGFSRSIQNIASVKQLEGEILSAKRTQPTAVGVVQVQINWKKHFTGYISEAWSFCEETFATNGGEKYLRTEQFEVGEISALSQFARLVSMFKGFKNKDFVIEFGITDDESLFLFQAVEVQPENIRKYALSRTISSLCLNRASADKRKGFVELMKNEWRAKKFRSMAPQLAVPRIDDLFTNWNFILHYYSLYCLRQNVGVSGQSWAKFLSAVSDCGHFGQTVRAHLKIANELSSKIGLPMSGRFLEDEAKTVFIGHGKEVIPSQVYIYAQP